MRVIASAPAPEAGSRRSRPRPAERSRPYAAREIGLATPTQRERIYQMRHAVYARELRQHPQNPDEMLRDELDERNLYIAATVGAEVAGFVSITPPGQRYSIDKYIARESLPFACDDGTYEIRLLTVAEEYRGHHLAALLMYAAFRCIEAQGGTRIVALGRREVLDLYLQVGLQPTGHVVSGGEVVYHLLHAPTESLRLVLAQRLDLLRRLERDTRWRLPIPFFEAPRCYHGGAFFEAIGEEFDSLDRRDEVINADVLDAWFPPSPRVLAALRDHLPWLVRTSPPTSCAGLVANIARARQIDRDLIVPGAGSSDLIFRALTRWLSRDSRVLILDPMYGEYRHVLEEVVRCRVDRWPLRAEEEYRVDPVALADRLHRQPYDLVIIVNPNSPTGQHLPRPRMDALLAEVPARTRVWVDETYVDYVGEEESVEKEVAGRDNLVVCKSMSKVYALSGLRVAYLCGPRAMMEELRGYTPPWVVGLPAQVAAVNALQDLPYYQERWRETHGLRDHLAESLRRRLGWEAPRSVANFLLCQLPSSGPAASTVVARARAHGLYLRDASTMGARMGSHTLRIAVKDAGTNALIVEILEAVLQNASTGRSPVRGDYGRLMDR